MISLRLLLVYSLFISIIVFGSKDSTPQCSLYLAPSLLGKSAGRGIFAGESISEGNTVVLEQSLNVKYSLVSGTQLNNYVYNSEADGFSMVVFGAACIFNHLKEKHLAHYWDDEVIPPISDQLKEAYTNFTKVMYVAEKDIAAGQEILVSYGRDSWFEERNIPFDSSLAREKANELYDLVTLKRVGHCLTDLYMDTSVIPMAGKGIFSKLAYKKGDIVSITPVLTLPKHIVENQVPSCVLINYCIGEGGRDSDVVLLPLTLAAMFNHGGVSANVAMDWYSWSDQESLDKALNMTPDTLVSSPFAQLDLAYRATRDIAVGEELLLFYGEAWERSWVAHLAGLEKWLASGDTTLASKPQFRHPIAPPAGLFPAHWTSGCIGENCAEHAKLLDAEEIKVDAEMKKQKKIIDESKAFARSHFLSISRLQDEF